MIWLKQYNKGIELRFKVILAFDIYNAQPYNACSMYYALI